MLVGDPDIINILIQGRIELRLRSKRPGIVERFSHEPRVAQDAAGIGVNNDRCVADHSNAHRLHLNND
jgi:hypothetical protein